MSTLGPRTALKSRKISGSLAYILAQTNVKQGTKAATNDVAGCTLEMGTDGKWYGDLGTMPKATADALYASGALANLATGATYRDTSGTQYTYSWGGDGAGWGPLESSDAVVPKRGVGYKRISGALDCRSSFVSSAATANETWLIIMCADDFSVNGISITLPAVQGNTSGGTNLLAFKAIAKISDAWNGDAWFSFNNTTQPALGSGVKWYTKYTDTTTGFAAARPIPREDGNLEKPMFAVLVQFASGAFRAKLQYPTLAGYRTNPKKGDLLSIQYSQSWAYPNSAWSYVSECPILGLNFTYTKKVVNVMRSGDSKMDGAGASAYVRDGFLVDVINNLSDMRPEIVICDMNYSCPSSDQFLLGAKAYIDAGFRLPDIILIEAWTPNYFATTAVNATNALNSMETYLGQFLTSCASNGVKVLMTNWGPTNTSVKDWTLTDYMRVDFNNRISSIVDINWDNVISGDIVAGQVQMRSDYTNDGIHENDAGIAALGKATFPRLFWAIK